MSQDTFREKHFPSTARKTIFLHFPRTGVLKVSVASTCNRVFKTFSLVFCSLPSEVFHCKPNAKNCNYV